MVKFDDPNTRGTIVQLLNVGASLKASAERAGVHEGTLHLWLAIGNAIIEGDDHPRIPKDESKRQMYVEFVEQVKRAQTGKQIQAITDVISAGRTVYVHRMTGIVRTSPPPPKTWMNAATGDIVFENPTGVLEGKWVEQWSGEVWKREPGQWQASAWILERTDPDTYGRRTYRRDETIERIYMIAERLQIDPKGILEDLFKELYAIALEDGGHDDIITLPSGEDNQEGR